MPAQYRFRSVPSFPSDSVSIAHLPIISFAKLIGGDKSQSKELFCASNHFGFFLLDFREASQGQELLRLADKIFDINDALVNLTEEEKEEYSWNPPHSLFGYKRAGSAKVENGKPDHYSFYNISHDEMLNNGPLQNHPPVIEKSRHDIVAYIQQCRDVSAIIVSHLEEHLQLPPRALLSRQDPERESGTVLRLLCCEPQSLRESQTNIPGHTDIGTITILFNVVGGLRILPAGNEPADGGWEYVIPHPGCAIINLGDAMVEWTGGVVRSAMHRVISPPGQQAAYRRLSVAYLIRAQADASMRRIQNGDLIPRLLKGENENEFSAKEWEVHKTKGITSGLDNARSRGGVSIPIC